MPLFKDLQTIRSRFGLNLVRAIRTYIDSDARSYALGERIDTDKPQYRPIMGGPSIGIDCSNTESRRYLRFLELSGKYPRQLKAARELEERSETLRRREGGAYLPQSKEEGGTMLGLILSIWELYDYREVSQDPSTSFFHQISLN